MNPSALNPPALNPCEISWFSALCDDDYEFLGVPDPKLRSSCEHCRDIVLGAEAGGFDNILLQSGYAHRFRRGHCAPAAAHEAAHGRAGRRDVAAPARAPDRHHRPGPRRAADH